MSTARSSTFYATRGLSGISHSRQLRGETKLHYREPVSVDKSNLREKLAAREVTKPVHEIQFEHKSEPEEKEPVVEVKLEAEPGLEEYYFPEDAEDGLEGIVAKEEESEDEEELLMRELARIKEERAAAEARRKAEEDARSQRIKEEEIAQANPLIGSSQILKRQWFQDTVFSNTTSIQPRAKKAHVNDPIRNEFHRKFLNKYIG